MKEENLDIRLLCIFLQFLEDNNCFENYFDNLFKEFEDPLNPFNMSNNCEELISSAFIWDITDQEQEYWSDLDCKWAEQLEKEPRDVQML